MSTTTPIDYEALAKQAGAISSAKPAVDYEALAKQAGAISSTSATRTSDVDSIRASNEARPWWKKALGLPADQATQAKELQGQPEAMKESLGNVADAYKVGGIEAAKTLPFMAAGGIAGTLGKGMPLLARAGLQAIGQGTAAALTGQSDAGVGTAAALGAAGPIAGAAGSKALPLVGKAVQAAEDFSKNKAAMDALGVVSPRAANALKMTGRLNFVLKKLGMEAGAAKEVIPPAADLEGAPGGQAEHAASLPSEPIPDVKLPRKRVGPTAPKMPVSSTPDLEGVTSAQTEQAGATGHPNNEIAAQELTKLATQRQGAGMAGNAMGYNRAASAIRALGDKPFTDMSNEELANLPGIGPKTLPKLVEIKKTLGIAEPAAVAPTLKTLKQAVPAQVALRTAPANMPDLIQMAKEAGIKVAPGDTNASLLQKVFLASAGK